MFKRLISLGIQKTQSRTRKFRIRMINIIVLLTIGLSVTYALVHLLVGDHPFIAFALLIYLIIALLTLSFNYLKKYHLTEYFLHILFPIWVAFTSILLGRDYQMESYLILSGLGAIFIFTNLKQRYYLLGWSFVLFLFTKIYFIYHPASLLPLTGKALPLLYILNGIAPVIAIGILTDNTFRNSQRMYQKLKEITANQEKIIEERTEEVKEQARALEVSNSELKRFSYISAHDLREPLRNIMSFSQLLERDLAANNYENIKEYSGYINSGINRIDSLTNDIVSYTEIEEHIPKTDAVDTQFIVNRIFSEMREVQEPLNLQAIHLPTVRMNGQLCTRLTPCSEMSVVYKRFRHN